MAGTGGWRRLVALVLTVLVPVAVLGGGWALFQRPSAPTGKAAAMDRTLRRSGRTEVVVLGSSLARTDVRVDVLAQELGVPEKDIVLLALPNATAAHWYAILENRIYGNGYRPKAVLIVGALTTMVTADVLMDANVERLVNQLSDDEPVLARKVFAAESAADFRWLWRREQAGELRDGLVERWRDLVLSAAFRKGRADAATRLAERANEVVFADEKMDYELHRAGSTGLSVGAVEALDLTGLDVERDSLLPDLVALAEAHGSRIVFVRTPFPPSNADNDRVPPAVETAAEQLLASSGAYYLDLRPLGLDDTKFRDMRHMTREGAEQFTRAVARSLRDLRVLRGGGTAGGVIGRVQPSAVERVPSLPEALRPGPPVTLSPCSFRFPLSGVGPVADAALAALGRPGTSPLRVRVAGAVVPQAPVDPVVCRPGWAVDGDGVVVSVPRGTAASAVEVGLAPTLGEPDVPRPAAWVAPGTTLRWTFDQPWSLPESAFEVLVVGHALGATDGLVVRAAGAELDVQRRGARAWAAGRPVAPGTAPWTLEIASPADGPWFLLQNVRVGRAPTTTDLFGLPEDLSGASIRLVGGKVEDTNLAPSFRTAPRPVSGALGPTSVGRQVGKLTLPAFAALADAPNTHAANPHKCSPLRIVEDGVVLEAPESTCADMARLHGGRSCHAGEDLFFTASDGTDPTRNGRTYGVILDPTRVCDRRNQRNTTPLRGSLWLYPGDTVVLDAPRASLEAFLDGANQLELALEPIVHPAAQGVLVRLSVGGRVVFEDRLRDTGRRRAYRKQLLDPALPPRATDVRLELVNEDPKAWWLVELATLSEAYAFGLPDDAEPLADDEDGAVLRRPDRLEPLGSPPPP
jgi:hypothetical protein